MTREIEEKASNYMRGRAMALFKPLSLEDVKEAYLCGAEDYAHISKPVNPWHKASEELPKERAFLVCKMGKQPIYKTLEYSSERDGFWTSSGGFITRDGVREYFTHWMPIPEIKED